MKKISKLLLFSLLATSVFSAISLTSCNDEEVADLEKEETLVNTNQNEKLYFDLSKDIFEFESGVTEETVKAEINKYISTNADTVKFNNLYVGDGTHTVKIRVSKGYDFDIKEVTILIGDESIYCQLTNNTFTFNEGVTEAEIKNTIKASLRTNATTISYINLTNAVGTHQVGVYLSLGSTNSIKTVTVIINALEQLELSLSKSSFDFTKSVTEAEIKAEIEKYVSTNGTLSYSTIDTTKVGSQTIVLTSTKNSSTKSQSLTINIKEAESELSLDLSKSSFDFTKGVTEAEIKTEIEKYVSTNGTLSYSTVDTTKVGSQTIVLTSTKNSSTKSQSLTINIKEAESELSLDLSKSSFEFTKGVTEAEIKTEIEKYVSTNGTLSYSAIDTTKIGNQIIIITSSKGSKSESLSLTINIKEVEAELSLNISKTSFNFIFEASEADIKTEIAKYITTNGTLSYSSFEAGKPGEQTITIYASKGNDMVFKNIIINIDEEIIVNLDISKTSFEFPLGYSLSNIKEYITSFVTTNGAISFRNLSTSVGSYNVIVDSIIEHKIISKNITVDIKGNDDVALELKKTSYEFLYGDTAEVMLLEIANYAITNGSLEIVNVPTECGSHDVVLKAVNNGKESSKTISITINPNKGGLKFTYISTSNSSTQLNIQITVTNNTGKEISSFYFNVLIHDGTYARAAFAKNVEFPITYGTSKTLKNGETNVISLVLKYNSDFKAVPISDYDNGTVSTTGYDYDYLRKVSSFSWKWSSYLIVFKD